MLRSKVWIYDLVDLSIIKKKSTQTFLEIKNGNYAHIFFDPRILLDPNHYRNFCQQLYVQFNISNIFESKKELTPIILISSLSSLSLEINSKLSFLKLQSQFLRDHPYCSFLFNSSIWFHYVELDFVAGVLQKKNSQINYDITITHLERISCLNIYSNPNAKEFIEYHFRLQQVNFLIGNQGGKRGHGDQIAPTNYSDEQKVRNEIKIRKDIEFLLPNSEKLVEKDFKVKGINIRILLVDDKIKDSIECKATLIKSLLELKFEPEDNFNLRKNVCWLTFKGNTESVKIFQFHCNGCSKCHKVRLGTADNTYKPLVEILQKSSDIIQIVAVPNLDEARKLLSDESLRFDLIMMDYLLDKKSNIKEVREYATEFWSDDSNHFFNITQEDIDNVISKDAQALKDREILQGKKNLYDKIKENRGPMQRLWIFPITAFNQTFIDDLRNRGIRLIDYYWFLSRGADPINTPYLFINTLNRFIQLQFEMAIFDSDKVIRFLKKSVYKVAGIAEFDEFIAFMGAEYSAFVEKFMKRPIIFRDKLAGSLFAQYVWREFYAKEENKNLFKLTNQVHKFYHRCAFGTLADHGKMILFWRELKIFLEEVQMPGSGELNIDIFYDKLINLDPRI